MVLPMKYLFSAWRKFQVRFILLLQSLDLEAPAPAPPPVKLAMTLNKVGN